MNLKKNPALEKKAMLQNHPLWKAAHFKTEIERRDKKNKEASTNQK